MRAAARALRCNSRAKWPIVFHSRHAGIAGRGFRVGILACFLFQGLGGDSGTRGDVGGCGCKVLDDEF